MTGQGMKNRLPGCTDFLCLGRFSADGLPPGRRDAA